MLAGADQEPPFQLSTFPALSTAMQKVVVGQETDDRVPVLSMFSGPDHPDGTAAVTVMENIFVDVSTDELESVTSTVKLEVPATVGVPEILPGEDSDSPVGKEPELTVQV